MVFTEEVGLGWGADVGCGQRIKPWLLGKPRAYIIPLHVPESLIFNL